MHIFENLLPLDICLLIHQHKASMVIQEYWKIYVEWKKSRLERRWLYLKNIFHLCDLTEFSYLLEGNVDEFWFIDSTKDLVPYTQVKILAKLILLPQRLETRPVVLSPNVEITTTNTYQLPSEWPDISIQN